MSSLELYQNLITNNTRSINSSTFPSALFYEMESRMDNNLSTDISSSAFFNLLHSIKLTNLNRYYFKFYRDLDTLAIDVNHVQDGKITGTSFMSEQFVLALMDCLEQLDVRLLNIGVV